MKKPYLILLPAFLIAALTIFLTPPQPAPSPSVPPSFDSFTEFIYSEANVLLETALRQGILPGQDVDGIESLYLSGSIPIYEVTTDQNLVEVNDMRYYVVLDQNNAARGMIIARAYSTEPFVTCEYNTAFHDELTLYKQQCAEICFIFDQTDIYIYDGTNANMVFENKAHIIDSRGVFDPSQIQEQAAGLDRLSINAAAKLELSPRS